MRVPHRTSPQIAAFALASILAVHTELHAQQNNAGDSSAPLSLKAEVLRVIANRYYRHVTPDTSLTAAQIVRTLDPFSLYRTRAEYEDDMISSDDRSYRFGLSVYRCGSHSFVLHVSQGSAADRAGIFPGDEILRIDGVKLATDSSKFLHLLYNAGKDTRTLELYRASADTQMTVHLVRTQFNDPSVPVIAMIDSITGYVQITGFHLGTASTVRMAVDKLLLRGMKTLVLDVRGNPGGYVSECLSIVNLFVHYDGAIVRIRTQTVDTTHDYHTLQELVRYPSIPLAVLVDQQSCSASELLSGVLQDLGRAVIIGEPTVGKALVMNYVALQNGDMLYLAIGELVLPSGRCIQRAHQNGRIIGTMWRRLENADNRKHVIDRQIMEADHTSYHTSAGTPIYGGEGIIPDVIVGEGNSPDWIRDAIYASVVPCLRDHAEQLENTRLDAFERCTIPDSVIEPALKYCEDHDTTADKHLTARLAADLPMLIKWYIAYHIWNEFGAFVMHVKNSAIIRQSQFALWEKLHPGKSLLPVAVR